MASIVAGIVQILRQILCSGNDGQQQSQQQQQQQQQQQWQQPQYTQPQQYQQPMSGPTPQESQNQYPGAQHHQYQQPHQNHQQQSHHKVQKYHNQNMENGQNGQYKALRDQARSEGSEMARCFDQAHAAHERGDGAQAKHLSDEGHRHQHEMERLNGQASDWIFRENNTDSGPGEIDLHGLYVKEAIAQTDTAIQAAQSRGDSEIHLIVGKGIHSAGHVAKIKPAIEELMMKHNLSAHLDPHNEGVLIVNLNGGGDGMSADEMTRRLAQNNDGCVVM